MGVFLWVGYVCGGGHLYLCISRVGGWGMLEGCDCIGRRERRETTPLYDISYIRLISSGKDFIPST